MIQELKNNDLETELEFERVVLGNLGLRPKITLNFNERLKPSSFIDPVHKEIYAALLDGVFQNKDVTRLEVQKKIAEKDSEAAKYFQALVTNHSTDLFNLKSYVNIINENSSRKSLGDDLKQISDDLLSKNITQDQALGKLLKHSQDNVVFDSEKEMSEVDWMLNLESLAKENHKRFRLGLPKIDNGICGGLKRGDILTIGGEYKSGKSTLALQFATSLRDQGLKVKWLALEMGANDIFGKMISRNMGITQDEFEQKLKNFDANKASIEKHSQNTESNSFSVRELRQLDIDSLISAIHRASYKDKADVVVVDYLQLVCAGRRSNVNRSDFLEELSSRIMAVVKDNDMIGIVLTQLNRDGQAYGTDGMNRACDFSIKIERNKEDENSNLVSITPVALRVGKGFNGHKCFMNINGTHFIEDDF